MKIHQYIVVLSLLLSVACSGLPKHSRSLASRDLESDYQHINPKKVLFGVEYSFQDETIVAEPGRMTMRTDHKAKKLELMFDNFLSLINTTRKAAIVKNTVFEDFKPGYVFAVPGDGNYTINMEPVTVEINTTPKTVFEIVDASTPIFEAADQAGLKPYVNPAAERSGMGHIHIGAAALRDSPFYKNPNLLRNMLVFYHKHPSVLYGFAEAYDIGDQSNIETYHNQKRQLAFKKAIAEYDEWYARAMKGQENMEKGLQEFLRILRKNEPEKDDFFHHYRAINMEHLKVFVEHDTKPNFQGKLTVEFRIFRPQKGPQHAEANTKLLLDIMETLSVPGHLEPFEMISPNKFKNFWSAGKIKSDWLAVKKIIQHDNEFSDEMLEEAIKALEEKPSYNVALGKYKNAKLFHAFSKKTDKGYAYELRIPAVDENVPEVEINQRPVQFELIKLDNKKFWISYIDSKELNLDPGQLTRSPGNFLKAKGLVSTILNCRDMVQSFF